MGLNVATRHEEHTDSTHAVFLSGNGALVAVLREALARDDFERGKKGPTTILKSDASATPLCPTTMVSHIPRLSATSAELRCCFAGQGRAAPRRPENNSYHLCRCQLKKAFPPPA